VTTATKPRKARKPTPDQILAARQRANLTQAQAAAVVHSHPRLWRAWEAGDHRMHPAMFELFKLKTEGIVFHDGGG
jgi:DNA-binding transcriptional regulator YiaG